MKKSILFLVGFTAHRLLAQGPPEKYTNLAQEADSLYQAKQYQEAAYTYTKAFEANGWMGYVPEFYGAAKAWAMIDNLDSAFRKLDRVITYSSHRDFKVYEGFTSETAFQGLHGDKRWDELVQKADKKYNNPLVLQLDSIFQQDQHYRLMADSVFGKHGFDSPEGQAIVQTMLKVDSVNLTKVKKIIDTHGWLSQEEVGQMGNTTLFLVIQHADSATQATYLPIMRKAVVEGKAEANQLALLEDRVALAQGRKQIYGSQIGTDEKTGQYIVLSLIDPDNVDKRRKEVGLSSLSEYVIQWGIEWNVEEYKRTNPDRQ